MKTKKKKNPILTLKTINKMKIIIIIKEERMHNCIVMGFKDSHIEICFTPKRI